MTAPVVRAPETDDELRECVRIAARGFNGALDDKSIDEWLPKLHRDRSLAVFVGDLPVAWSQVRPFGQFFGGRSVPMGGYSPVVVAPEHRGRGYGSVATAAHFPLLRERGEVIAGLYPAQTQLYRGSGFEVAGALTHRTVPTRSLQRLRPAGHVTVRRGGQDDLPAIQACYRRFAATQDGWLDRPDVWWTNRIFEPGKLHEQHLYLVDGEGGAGLAGYLRYTHRAAEPHGYTIVVEDLCAEEPDVALALWRLVGSSSTQAERAQVPGPPEHPLLLQLPDQDLTTIDEIRWMLRVVDAPGAVAARGFPPAVRATVDLEVTDRQCDWNGGHWRLTVEDGSGVLAKGGSGDVALTINALSCLYSGYGSPTVLRQAGLIAPGASVRALADLAAVFSGPTPSIADFY
ncbi:MAG TPA: GNAT family N-acetyltransferase [Acidimicrobiales bacterium]|nr:GNAT family N-acetyltransferase [Acidimicrobiales bacterium]